MFILVEQIIIIVKSSYHIENSKQLKKKSRIKTNKHNLWVEVLKVYSFTKHMQYNNLCLVLVRECCFFNVL